MNFGKPAPTPILDCVISFFEEFVEGNRPADNGIALHVDPSLSRKLTS